MKNKRIFNNLFDSICITVLFILFSCFYSVVLWFDVVNHQEDATPIEYLIIFTLLFAPAIIILGIWIITKCYEYWILTEKSICSKKIFRKKVVINLCDIENVEKKVIDALILGPYKSEAYIIQSQSKKITILINERKKYYDLDNELAKFINQ